MGKHRIWKSKWSGRWRLDIGGGSYVQFEFDTWKQARRMSTRIRRAQVWWEAPDDE